MNSICSYFSGITESNDRSSSPSDGDLFDRAISGLADIDMDDNSDYPKLFQNTNNDDSEDHTATSTRTVTKRPRSDNNDSGEWRAAIKLTNVAGKPAAKHWEREVQDVIAEAIWAYENKLLVNGFFPDHMQEVTWAKAAWLEGCHECSVKIHHNTELIKIVSLFLLCCLMLIKSIVSLLVVPLISAVS